MEVDAFGRTRPMAAPRRESFSPSLAAQHAQEHRSEDRTRESRGRRRYSSPLRRDTQAKRPRYDDDARRDFSHREEGPRRDASALSGPVSTVRKRPRPLPPMMSFRSFTQAQRYDAPPEVYQRKYEEYQLQYAHDASDHFFDTHKFDEWFLDRYHPLHMHEREKAAVAWAATESRSIAAAAFEAPLTFLRACCLEPEGTVVAPVLAAASEPAGESSSLRQADVGALTATLQDSGKHLRGHLDRTIYLSGIPSSCPRADLEAAVVQVLEQASEQERRDDVSGDTETAEQQKVVDRVLLAQPMWHKKELAMSFDKCAWVVLAPGALDMKTALRALRDCRFSCPGPVDTATGLPTEGFTFRVTLNQHSFRGVMSLPDHMSSPRRVAADTWKAMRLAHLLDKERGVPETCRLSHLLSPKSNPDLVNWMRQPTDILDVSIAYLRRVHFVVYYAGLRFHDEAHLLTSPYIFVRGVPYCLPRPPLPSCGPPPAVSAPPGGPTADTPADADLEAKDAEYADESAARWRRRGSSEGDLDEGRGGQDEDEDCRDRRERNGCAGAGWSAYGGGAETELDGSGMAESTPESRDIMFTAVPDDGEPRAEDIEPQEEDEVAAESSDVANPAVLRAVDKIENWRRLVKSVRARIVETQIDSRLDRMKADLEARARRVAKGGVLSLEEEHAEAILRLNAELTDSFVTEHCTVQEDGRARCGVESCGKLFKSTEFLEKHIRSKHMALAQMRIIEKSVEYTRDRFEADSISQRPLPLIEVEAGNGVEKRSVKDVVEGAHSRLLAMDYGHGGRRRGERSDHHGIAHSRGRDDRKWQQRDPHRRSSGLQTGGPNFPAPPAPPPLPPGAPPGPNVTRKMSYYVDVDEPQESAPMDLDYGVAVLPPPKKRKKSLGVGSAAPAA